MERDLIPASEKIDSLNCPRCGGRHINILPKELTISIYLNSKASFTHWYPCPVNGEPIVLGNFYSADINDI
jgi:hypothetical protein